MVSLWNRDGEANFVNNIASNRYAVSLYENGERVLFDSRFSGYQWALKLKSSWLGEVFTQKELGLFFRDLDTISRESARKEEEQRHKYRNSI